MPTYRTSLFNRSSAEGSNQIHLHFAGTFCKPHNYHSVLKNIFIHFPRILVLQTTRYYVLWCHILHRTWFINQNIFFFLSLLLPQCLLLFLEKQSKLHEFHHDPIKELSLHAICPPLLAHIFQCHDFSITISNHRPIVSTFELFFSQNLLNVICSNFNMIGKCTIDQSSLHYVMTLSYSRTLVYFYLSCILQSYSQVKHGQ